MTNIPNTMDGDESSKQEEAGDSLIDGGDVLPPFRVRCGFLHASIGAGFLCYYYTIFLPCISGIIWGLFLLFWS